jgi:poly(A) polymerase
VRDLVAGAARGGGMNPADLAERLGRSAPVATARAALDPSDCWIVGGAVRDALLGRPVVDLDLAVGGGERAAAEAVARAAGGHSFLLSGEFATWRATDRDQTWTLDLAPLRGGSIQSDLAARDFTVNAMAVPLAGGELIDPHGGAADLESGVLRAVGERSFGDDPLRLLRAARIGAELGFDLEKGTVRLARDQAGRAAEPAGERQFAELRMLVAGPDPLRGLGLMDELEVTAAVLPELEGLRGVEQNPYHHLDVHGHTIAVLEAVLALGAEPQRWLGECAAGVTALLAEPFADELTRGGALRFGALFHDLGKPQTRTVNDEGRVLFLGHDRAGAEIVERICERLRASRRLRDFLRAVTLYHLRLGFLVHSRPLSRRQVYDYLIATDPYAVEVTVLTVADRLATQGPRTRREAIDAHLELARDVLAEALAWRRDGPPRPPLAGDDLASELGIEPGPQLGRLLKELSAARFAGEASTREEAIELARRLL